MHVIFVYIYYFHGYIIYHLLCSIFMYCYHVLLSCIVIMYCHLVLLSCIVHVLCSCSHYKKIVKLRPQKVVTKWSLERYSDHLVTTTCSLRKSGHKDKSVTKWSQSATTRNVVFNLSGHNNVVTNNDHNNVVTNNDHICGHK